MSRRSTIFVFSWLLALVFLTACGSIVPGGKPTFTLTASPTCTIAPTRTPTPLPSPTLTNTPTPLPLTVQVVQIPAPSLLANYLDEPQQQPLLIFLPPSYDFSDHRYPVVYFLPGFGSSAEGEHDFFEAPEIAARMANGTLKEMILVVPNGANVLHGSFYVNSPVTGNWEDFIIRDVVSYIDANYRTFPRGDGRAIGGFSMGGFGAITLAMRHPDMFSAVYLLSAGLFDENGLQDSHMFNTENKPRAFLETLAEIKLLPHPKALHAMANLEGAQGFSIAYGAAFAPHPGLGLPYFDYPYQFSGEEAVKNPEIWRKWENGFGGWKDKIKIYQENLAELDGIVIDYAAKDGYRWIPRGSRYLSSLLAAAGIPNQLVSYAGDHGDHQQERLLDIMLPFFSKVLVDPE